MRSASNLAYAYVAAEPARAERLLRQVLAVRRRTLADDWSTFEAEGLPGASLLAQKNYADAEPLLPEGYRV